MNKVNRSAVADAAVEAFIQIHVGDECPGCGVKFETADDVRAASAYYRGHPAHPGCYQRLRQADDQARAAKCHKRSRMEGYRD